MRSPEKRILVTGHRGYIGAPLVDMLLRRGYEVVGLDTGYFVDAEVAPLPQPREVRVADLRAVRPADLVGVHAVIHLAALSNDASGELDPQLTFEINTQASARLARLAKDAGVARFICASSCSVYGVQDGRPATEDSPVEPRTAYARSKLLMEDEVSALADTEFAPTFLRNGTAYGFSPSLRLDLVLNNLVAEAMASGKIVLRSNGSPWRPMVHVEDLAAAAVAVLEAPTARVANRIFNVGADDGNHRVIEVAEAVRAVVPGSRVEVMGSDDRDDRSYRVDFSALRDAVPDFRPRWSIASGAAHLFESLSQLGLPGDDLSEERFARVSHLQSLITAGELDGTLRWTRESVGSPGEPA